MNIGTVTGDGTYDLSGTVVSGPPPKPLEQFVVNVRGSGGEGEEVTLPHNVKVRPYFSPEPLGIVAAELISRSDRRLRIVSPVVTSGPVLGTLVEFASRDRFDLEGAYDHTQMEEVQRAWTEVEHNHWKIEAWKVIAPRLSGKRSTPWSPSSVGPHNVDVGFVSQDVAHGSGHDVRLHVIDCRPPRIAGNAVRGDATMSG